MARVWCAVVRWSSRSVRLHATGMLCLTFLVLLTTNLYLVNRTVLDINTNRYKSKESNDQFTQEHLFDTERTTNEENILLKKLRSLKDELKQTRSRIDNQKQLVSEYKRDLAQNPQENKLKRHLMNAAGIDKSLVTAVTTSMQQQQLNHGIRQFLSTQSQPNSSYLSCLDLPSDTHSLEHIGAGYTKQVKKLKIGENVVALKTVNMKGHDRKECAQYGMSDDNCVRLANYKVLKELALLQQLESPHVIKVRLRICFYY